MATSIWVPLALGVLQLLLDPRSVYAGPGYQPPRQLTSPWTATALPSAPAAVPQAERTGRRHHRKDSVRAEEIQIASDHLWLNVQKMRVEDLVYAKALAEALGSPGSAARAACWGAWIKVLGSAESASAGVRGLSLQGHGESPASQYEQSAQVADNFQAGTAFMVACEPVARAQGMHVSVWVAAVAAGGVPLLRLAPGL